jgi:hypothetical protein
VIVPPRLLAPSGFPTSLVEAIELFTTTLSSHLKVYFPAGQVYADMAPYLHLYNNRICLHCGLQMGQEEPPRRVSRAGEAKRDAIHPRRAAVFDAALCNWTAPSRIT